jgi:HK97 gp10 family phage protein
MSDITIKSYVPQAVVAVDNAVKNEITKTIIKITAQAKSLANFEKNYQTGQLKGSIMWKTGTKSGGNTSGTALTEKTSDFDGIVGTANDHGIYVEKGTRKMAAQPYLEPAVSIVTGSGFEKSAAKSMANEMKGKLKN